MKRLVLLLGLVIVLAGCQKQLPDFAVLKVTDNADVAVQFGDKLLLKTTDGDVSDEYVLDGDSLIISGNADVILTVPQDKISMISTLVVDGEADLVFDTTVVWTFENGLIVNVGTDGDLYLRLAAPFAKFNLSGNSDLYVTGDTCTSVTLVATDNSTLHALNFQVKDYEIDVSGEADAYLYATNSISGTVKDDATVEYKGTPDTSQVTVSDNASLIHYE